jgi:hypothetical protein
LGFCVSIVNVILVSKKYLRRDILTRVDTKFRDTNKNYFRISRNYADEYRDISRQIAKNFAKRCQFGWLDLGHAPNQIGQDYKGLEIYWGHAKIDNLFGIKSGLRLKSNRKTHKTCYRHYVTCKIRSTFENQNQNQILVSPSLPPI